MLLTTCSPLLIILLNTSRETEYRSAIHSAPSIEVYHTLGIVKIRPC